MLVALMVVGCGPEEDNNFDGFPNNTPTDSGMDAGDATEEVGAEADGEDVVGDVIIGQSCEARPEDLGTSSVGESLDFDRPFRQRPDGTRASCGEGCDSEEACVGDGCAGALQVDVSGGTQTLSGDRYAYVSNWDAEGRSNCAFDDSGEGSATPDDKVIVVAESLEPRRHWTFDIDISTQ